MVRACSSVVELWFYTPAVGGSIPSTPTREFERAAGPAGDPLTRLVCVKPVPGQPDSIVVVPIEAVAGVCATSIRRDFARSASGIVTVNTPFS